MKSKRKEITKYNVGGYLQAGLGTAQTIYGLTQLPKARAEFERAQAAAPSLDTPSQFYENYKNAYDSELARMQDDMIQRNLATSVQALQGAGGRALVGGLQGAVTQGQAAQIQMLSQERAARMQAGQQLATAEERAIGRKEARSTRDIQMANKAMQAALGNVGAGIGAIGTGLMYGLRDAVDNETPIVDVDSDVQTSGTVYGPPPPPETGVDDALTQNLLKLDPTTRTEPAVDMQAIDTESKEGEFAQRNPMMQAEVVKQSYEKNYGPSRNVDFSQPPLISPLLPEPAEEEPTGVIDEVSTTVANNLYSKMEESIERSVPKSEFDESMVGEGQFYQIFGDTVIIRNMSPQQLREKRFFEAVGNIGRNVLTGSGMQSVVGNLKKQGGMMTSGEFNHATNPIDIVQNGQKVGEATGNEYIINPTQASKIAKESSYAKKLFKLFERKAKKNK